MTGSRREKTNVVPVFCEFKSESSLAPWLVLGTQSPVGSCQIHGRCSDPRVGCYFDDRCHLSQAVERADEKVVVKAVETRFVRRIEVEVLSLEGKSESTQSPRALEYIDCGPGIFPYIEYTNSLQLAWRYKPDYNLFQYMEGEEAKGVRMKCVYGGLYTALPDRRVTVRLRGEMAKGNFEERY